MKIVSVAVSLFLHWRYLFSGSLLGALLSGNILHTCWTQLHHPIHTFLNQFKSNHNEMLLLNCFSYIFSAN